MGKIVTKCCAT